MNRTLALIKPDAVDRNIIGEIIALIEQKGFTIRDMKFMKMSQSIAEKFYEAHKEKSFYDKLVTYMTSGNIIALILEKDNAVKLFRDLIGSTDPQLAEEGTIRKLYAIDKSFNSIHGSDSDANAEREISIIFNH
tara:strand:- start:941 stop:1342 length:402 start_codon:yes stop_codon:yes gene_type:complete